MEKLNGRLRPYIIAIVCLLGGFIAGITYYNGENTGLKNTNKKLERAIADNQKQIDLLTKSNKKLRTEKDTLVKGLDRLRESTNRAIKYSSQLGDGIGQAGKTSNDIVNDLGKLEKRAENIDKRIQELEDEIRLLEGN